MNGPTVARDGGQPGGAGGQGQAGRAARQDTAAPAGAGSTDPRRWYALVLLCAASFMVILDAQIVLVAVPSIQRNLRVPAANVQWVLSGYALAFGGLLLAGGRAADLFGRRRVFMAGVGLFTLSSLACGLAWSGPALIAARAVQGLSAAVMSPAAMAIMITTFPEGPERNKALGLAGAVGAAGGSAGALVGGPLTQGLGWQWVFFLNVPIGIAMFALSPLLLRATRPGERRRGLDLTGALTISGALVLFVDAIGQAPGAGWAARVLGPLAGSVLALALFVAAEKRSAQPLVPLRMFRSRILVGGNLVTLAAAIGAYGQGILLTEYAQHVLGYSPAQFGVMTAVVPVMAVAGSVAGQRLVTRAGVRAVAVVSMGLITAGCVLFTQLSADGSFVRDMLPGMLVFGPGLGAATVAASIAAVTGVAEQESGLASGMNETSFQIGGALGVALLTSIAVSWTAHVQTFPHVSHGLALTEGFRAAFAAAAAVALAGLLTGLLLLRQPPRSSAGGEG
jgi:EmrB/QacA subfamily drug resistance transporter